MTLATVLIYQGESIIGSAGQKPNDITIDNGPQKSQPVVVLFATLETIMTNSNSLARNIPENLEDSLARHWDSHTLKYDTSEYPFSNWVVEQFESLGYQIDDLRNLHKIIPNEKTYEVSQEVSKRTNSTEFRNLIEKFVTEVVVPETGLKEPIGLQRYLNIRLMLPNRPESVFPFHTGLLYGHGPATRSLWMPLTDVRAAEDRNASMQIISLERSRELVNEAIERKLTIREMTEFFGRESKHLKLGPGEVCLFNQENIHGNFVNDTGKTRVSIDFRLGEFDYGSLLGRKSPASYFKLIDRSKSTTGASASYPYKNDKGTVMYNGTATAHTFGIPNHLQRFALKDFAQRNKIQIEFEFFELDEMTYLPTLEHIINELKQNCVLYSIYSLPENKERRMTLMNDAVKNGVILHFANEDISVDSRDGASKVERYLDYSKYDVCKSPIGLPESPLAEKIGSRIAGLS